jgi:hypothetical protein
VKKKEVADYLKRWQRVNDRQRAELRQTSFKVRFVQTAALMRFAKSLNWRKELKKEEGVRDYWRRLRRLSS